MIINNTIEDAERWCVYDCAGNLIPYVVSFDTETCEIEMAVVVGGGKVLMQPYEGTIRPVYITFKLVGAYAEKKTAEELEEAKSKKQQEEEK
jgi:hypothetical protein